MKEISIFIPKDDLAQVTELLKKHNVGNSISDAIHAMIHFMYKAAHRIARKVGYPCITTQSGQKEAISL